MLHIDIDLNNINDTDYYNTKKYIYNNNEYSIIKYNRDKVKELELTDFELFSKISKIRSVILKNNKVVVYSPAKSLTYEMFEYKYTDPTQNRVEDFIDGTMINVFYDNNNECWEIATKSTIGGNIHFFNDIKNYSYFENYNNNTEEQLTFRNMFFEACNSSNFDLNTLNKEYSYTFILQHPYNRIVTPVSTPVIYLLKVYKIDNKDFPIVNIVEENIQEFVNNPPYIFMNTQVKFVNKYEFSDYETLKKYANNKDAPFHYLGCMIYNSDGNRTKIRNQNYEFVRKLRGNQPKLQYNYLCLKKNNKIKEFLSYYPEHAIIFNKFKILMFQYTNNLFNNYIDCFIHKTKPLKEYPFQYKNHMYHLHDKYKTELKPNNLKVDKKVVIDYVNELHPAQQMFVINYNYKNMDKNIEENMEEEKVNTEINE